MTFGFSVYESGENAITIDDCRKMFKKLRQFLQKETSLQRQYPLSQILKISLLMHNNIMMIYLSPISYSTTVQ